MKLTVVKHCLRIAGTIIGLIGILMLSMGAVLVWRAVREEGSMMIFFSGFAAVLGAYLVYVGYLTWFRFTSHAVRHICGTLAFFLLTMVGAPSREIDPLLGGFIFVALLVAAYTGYRVASGRLNRLLFAGDARVLDS